MAYPYRQEALVSNSGGWNPWGGQRCHIHSAEGGNSISLQD